MNPGITFQSIVDELNPVSILLTSGTLSPIESYEAELKIPFDVKLSCKHVIDPQKQILVRVVKHSLNRHKLTFNFNARNNDGLIIDLANSLINVVKVIPCGVLVFFTSYQMMNLTLKRWREEKFEDDLSFYQKLNSLKTICVEVYLSNPRVKTRGVKT